MGIAPIVCHGLLKASLFALWSLPVSAGYNDVVGVPFGGVMTFVRASLLSSGHLAMVQIVEVVFVVAFSLLVLVALARSTAGVPLKIAAAAYIAFDLSLTAAVWIEDWAFMRAMTEAGVLGAIVLATATPPLRRAGSVLLVLGLVLLTTEMFVYR